MTGEALALGAALVVACGGWAFMFLPDRRGVWTRTWITAGALVTTSVVALASLGRLGEVAGPFTAVEVGLGVAVGAAWLVATHVGYAVISGVLPSFGDQVEDLYRLGDEDTVARMVGPVVAMGVAEEALFRGVLQGVGSFALGLAAYAAVQLFERKWALVLAAVLGGAVWGALFAWRDGLVAPVVAHVLWTGLLTFVWPLGGPRPPATRRGTAPAAPA